MLVHDYCGVPPSAELRELSYVVLVKANRRPLRAATDKHGLHKERLCVQQMLGRLGNIIGQPTEYSTPEQGRSLSTFGITKRTTGRLYSLQPGLLTGSA